MRHNNGAVQNVLSQQLDAVVLLVTHAHNGCGCGVGLDGCRLEAVLELKIRMGISVFGMEIS